MRLTPKQAAAHATVSEGLIRKWIKEGTLPHFRLGARGRRGKILIAVEDLDGVLASFKVEKKESEPKPATSPPPIAYRHVKL